jgi:hypothetical protein
MSDTQFEPVASTDEPVASTDEPVASTDEPVASTDEPVASTDEPVASTDEPVASTDEQSSNSSKLSAVPVDKGESMRLYLCMRIQEVRDLGKKSSSESGTAARESLIGAYRTLFGLFDIMLNFVVNSVEDPRYKKKLVWPKSLDRMRIIIYSYEKAILPELAKIFIDLTSDKFYPLVSCVAEIQPCMSEFLSLPLILDELLPKYVDFAIKILPFIHLYVTA